MSRIWNKICDFQTPISASLVFAFVGLYFCALRAMLWVGLAALILSLVPIVWIHVVYARHGGFRHTDRYVMGLLVIFCAFLSLSLLLFGIRTLAGGGRVSVGIGALVGAVCFDLLGAAELLYLRRVRGLLPRRTRVTPLWRTLLPIGILCAVLVLLNLRIFHAWLRWDSYDYFYYISRISYQNLTNLESLRLANHAAYGASLLYIPVNGITGDPVVSVYAVNLLVLVLGTFLFWRIVTKRFPRWKPVSHLLVTCVFALSPFQLGSVYSISLETFLIFGLLLFFWGEVEEMPFGQVVGALMICFGKETGAVVLCCIMAARLLPRLLGKAHRGEPFLRRISPAVTLPVLCLGLIWLYDLLSFSWLSSNSIGIQIQSGSGFNRFDLNPLFIQNRLISLVFSCFTWLILLVVALGFLVGCLKRKEWTKAEDRVFLFECLAGTAALLATTLLFVTYNHIRYIAPIVFFLVMLLPDALDRLFSGAKPRAALCGALALLSLAQCYFTVDPMMYVFFDRLDKGNGSIVYTGNDILKDGSVMNSIAVNSQYNREIMYFDFALDELLANMGYQPGDTLIFSAQYRAPCIGGYVFSEYLITGFGYPHMEQARYIAWDADAGRRYLSNRPEDAIRIGYASKASDLLAPAGAEGRYVYIQLPFGEQTVNDRILEGVPCRQIGEGRSNGWHLVALEILP